MVVVRVIMAVKEKSGSRRRKARCSMSVRCGLLMCLLAALPLPAFSLKVVHLPGNSVRLLKSTAILIQTSDDRLAFSAISDIPHCWFYEQYEVNVRKSVGGNPVLKDVFGRQWYEFSYITFPSLLIVKINGTKNTFIPRRWSVNARCRQLGMVFTFPSRNVTLGTRWNRTLVQTFFSKYNNRESKPKIKMMESQFFKTFYNTEIEKLFTFEKAGHFNVSLKGKPIKNIDEYLHARSSNDANIFDSFICILEVGAMMTVGLIFMYCCLCLCKKVPKRVKTVTIVRRIPVPESENSSPLVTVGRDQHPDLPPSYDDIEQDSPPPPYFDVHSDQLGSGSGEATPGALLAPVASERGPSSAQPSPCSDKTVSGVQSFPITAVEKAPSAQQSSSITAEKAPSAQQSFSITAQTAPSAQQSSSITAQTAPSAQQSSSITAQTAPSAQQSSITAKTAPSPQQSSITTETAPSAHQSSITTEMAAPSHARLHLC